MYINENIYNEDLNELTLLYKKESYKVLFDKDDYDKIKQYHWRISKKKNKLYVCTGQNRNGNKILYLHNIIMNFTPNKIEEIDHINGESLDNRKSNLRKVNRQINIQNSKPRKENKFGIRGLSYNKKSNLYSVDLIINKRRYYFKQFKTLEEAVYLRYLCDTILLKDIKYIDEEIYNSYISKLTEQQMADIKEYFFSKIN